MSPAPGEVLADLHLATRLQALAMRLVPRAERDILLRDILATGADILGATRSQLLAFDAEGHLTYLAEGSWRLAHTQELFPEVVFHKTRESV